MQTNWQTLDLQCDAHIATLALNRPEVRNAFNGTMVAELTQAMQMLGAREDIRVIVLAANGPAFCAGADLAWMQSMAAFDHAQNLADAHNLADMLHALDSCPLPVLVKVQGDCYAGGLGLVAACDIAIGAEGANFCLSEVKLGLIPATISPYVVRAIGERAARRYFLTAERFDAVEAQRIGLLHEAVPDTALDARVADIANVLCTAGPQAVKRAKRLVREVAARNFDDALRADTADWIAGVRASDEGREGMQAFLEKRKPSWLA
jgi:methylglutaconyl-CoA hydratase